MQHLAFKTKIVLIAMVMTALLFAAINQTLIGTITPQIIAELGEIGSMTGIFTVFMLLSTIATALTGSLSDLYGRKPLLVAGIVLLLIGTFLCGVSGSIVQLITFRGIQGAGVGILIAISFTVVGDLFAPHERGRWLGLMTSVYGAASLLGPVLGGFIVDHANWHWAFLFTLPFGIVALVFIVMRYPSISKNTNSMTVFSILPIRLLKNKGFMLSSIIGLMTSVSMFGTMMYAPLFFQGVMGTTAAMSGTIMIPLTLSLVAANAASGWIITRTGKYKILACLGLIAMIAGNTLIAAMSSKSSIVEALLFLTLYGLGLGIALSVFSLTSQNAVDHPLLGTATAAYQLFRQLGGTIGVSVMGALLGNHMTLLSDDVSRTLHTELLQATLQDVFRIGVVATIFAFGFSLFLKENIESERNIDHVDSTVHYRKSES